ncbi:hypothetical protein VTJ49DRAFT_671 [Mycothermus thermophilus]|uniref:Phosphoglycerate mutase n=1 Tax=Humicola insolens TaxID=85995 RepID=A0ABR3VEE4_HUMIN
MGLPPAYLFVIRHGYRLDAADKQWHLSSPTPYDPPLTYSGWQQAQSLGVRIASIIRERIREDELAASRNPDPSAKRKRKKYQVVLHSSPFLRCIQTSIAISAGLARDSTPFVTSVSPTTPQTQPSSANGRPKPTVVTDVHPATTAVKIPKSVLRLDAFLGEWLNPSYFELITPPPESVMMLASATADLLRREDYTHYPDIPTNNQANLQGHLWSPVSREGSTSRPDSRGSGTSLSDSSTLPAPTGYVAPVPHYAIGSNNTIPAGYVSHARDACVAVDYQWHSNRSGLNWGDGGTYPEEWAAMHKRFRAGVQSLVDWYSTADVPTLPVTKTVRPDLSDDEDDIETEAVVILVSHGAGCNALIGAITHQPVLMDVAMASLTMAVRKPGIEETLASWPGNTKPKVHELYDLKIFANTDHLRSPTGTPTSSANLSVPLNGIRGRHSSFSTSINSFTWNDGMGPRGSAANSGLSNLRTPNDTPIPRLNFNHNKSGGITIGSGVTSFTSARPSNLGRSSIGSTGLWSPSSSRLDKDDEDDDFIDLPFGGKTSTLTTTTITTTTITSTTAAGAANTSPTAAALERALEKMDFSANQNSTTTDGTKTQGAGSGSGTGTPSMSSSSMHSAKPEPGQLGLGAGGLWRQSRPPPGDDADRLRDTSASKRRWTVTERGA